LTLNNDLLPYGLKEEAATEEEEVEEEMVLLVVPENEVEEGVGKADLEVAEEKVVEKAVEKAVEEEEEDVEGVEEERAVVLKPLTSLIRMHSLHSHSGHE